MTSGTNTNELEGLLRDAVLAQELGTSRMAS